MSELISSYRLLKPSIVAIVQRVSTHADLPEIIGTGFIVDGDNGLIMTNHHVVDAMRRLPRVKGSDDWPASILIIKETDRGLITLYSDIKAAMHFELTELSQYTSSQPDMALLRTDLKNLPRATLGDSHSLAEGQEIATAGFPLGDLILRDGTTISQLGPTLKHGVISALLPFPCESPHAILLDIPSQGGQSGSPIFDPKDGTVIGLLFAGVEEPRRAISVAQASGPTVMQYRTPTNLTYAVPVSYLRAALDKAHDAPELKTHLAGKLKDYNKFCTDAYKELGKGVKGSRPKPETVEASQVEHPGTTI